MATIDWIGVLSECPIQGKGETMRFSDLAALCLAGTALMSASASAQTPQVSPVRPEFTRPGGTPGAARGIVRPSDTYMIAPAQPDAAGTGKKRKRR